MDCAKSEMWAVSESDAGGRLDGAVSARLGLSRAAARRLLLRGGVQLNGRVASERDKGYQLCEGDCIEVERFVREDQMQIVAQCNAAEVVDEGEGWVVMNKPAGMAVHPLRADETGTLLNAVVAKYPQVQGVGEGGEGGLRSGVVHRLDGATSGAVVVATTQGMWQSLREAFTDHRMVKQYYAVVSGRLTGRGEEAMNLKVACHRPARVKVVPSDETGARRCTLTWRALETNHRDTLVEIDLGSGFLHQIRVMMAELGHPVLGDAVYGDAESAERLMLHARVLRWGAMDVTVEAPAVFSR